MRAVLIIEPQNQTKKIIDEQKSADFKELRNEAKQTARSLKADKADFHAEQQEDKDYAHCLLVPQDFKQTILGEEPVKARQNLLRKTTATV